MTKPALSFILLLVLSSFRLQAQVSTPDLLKEDLQTLQKTLRENYPSLYRFADSAHIDSLFEQAYTAVQKQPTELELYKQLKHILSSIGDGHLSSRPSPALDTLFGQKARYFPIRLRFNSQGTYVDATVNNMLPPGAEVFLINGKSVRDIKHKLYPYMIADGYITTGKDDLLSEAFYFYYWLVFGEQSMFDIVYKAAGNVNATVRVNALPEKELPEAETPVTNTPLLQLRFEQGIGILAIATFNRSQLKEGGFNFEQFMDDSFKEMNKRHTQKLIIDLRGNGGGRDLYGALLYTYLTDKPFYYYKSLQAATPQLPYPMLAKDISSYNDLSIAMLHPDNSGQYNLDKAAHPNLDLIQPAGNNYKGKVWFLVNGTSFSTTAEFCAIAYSNRRGVFVGEETSGAYEGNTSGAMMQVKLPNTGIKVNYGAIRYNMDVKPASQKGRGIIPDVKVIKGFGAEDMQLKEAIRLALSN